MDLAADEVASFVARAVNAVDGAVGLDDGAGQGLAALPRDVHGEMGALAFDQGGRPTFWGRCSLLATAKSSNVSPSSEPAQLRLFRV